jgi:cell wall-associated NlpC family hydrolase
LTWYIYKELFGININLKGVGKSSTTKQMTSVKGILYRYYKEDPEKHNRLHLIRTGDILFFHRQSLNEFYPTNENYFPGHCGIYLEYRRFIHATQACGGVVISSLDAGSRWLADLVGSKNIIKRLAKKEFEKRLH